MKPLSHSRRRLPALFVRLALFALLISSSGCQWIVDFDRSLIVDAGPDADTSDAGALDGGATDAGLDAGVADAGMTDAGPDAGMSAP